MVKQCEGGAPRVRPYPAHKNANPSQNARQLNKKILLKISPWSIESYEKLAASVQGKGNPNGNGQVRHPNALTDWLLTVKVMVWILVLVAIQLHLMLFGRIFLLPIPKSSSLRFNWAAMQVDLSSLMEITHMKE